MKLLFSLSCLVCTCIQPREIVLIDYCPTLSLKALKEDIGRLGIPEKLVNYRATKTCPKNAETVLQLCLSPESFKIVHADEEVLERSFKVFGYGKDR